MPDPFIGEIMMFAGNFAPRGWALCDGQLLSIASNQALFSILGTTYGGDGRTTFGLPDLRSRFAMHAGQGPGLSSRRLGQKGGEETVTLTPAQTPSHNHGIMAKNRKANSQAPTGNVLAIDNGQDQIYSSDDPDVALKASACGNAGGGQPHDNMSPFQCVNYIIALIGVFPSRS